MDLMKSELDHMYSFRQAHQCMQMRVAKRRVGMLEECHAVIREEDLPDPDYHEENVPDDSVDHKIQNSNGSSTTSDRSVCEEFRQRKPESQRENVGPLSQDDESEYRVPAEIKSFIVAGTIEDHQQND